MYAQFYRQDELADCDIVLIPEDTPEPRTGKQPDGSRSEPGHGILLCGKSEVLHTKLRTAVGKRSPDASEAGKKRCYIQVSLPLACTAAR